MVIGRVMLLSIAAAALSPAEATVTFIKLGAYSSNTLYDPGPITIQHGPTEETTTYAPGIYSTDGEFYWGNSFENVTGSAKGGIQVYTPGQVDLLAEAKGVSAAVPFTNGYSAALQTTLLYEFSIDAASTISLTYGATSPIYTGADVFAHFYSLNSAGYADHYYVSGEISGIGTLLSMTLAPGRYGLDLGAAAFPYLNNQVPQFQSYTDQQTGEIELSVKALPITPPVSGVPEPASWAMMMLGIGAIGAASRGRRGEQSACAANRLSTRPRSFRPQ